MAKAFDPEALRRNVRAHVRVFIVLIAGMLISVLGSSWMTSTPAKVGFVLAIATIQAVLVAWVLMHLASEGKSIRALLALTGVFFVVMMALCVFAAFDVPKLKSNPVSAATHVP